MTSFGHIIRTGSALLFAIVGGWVGVYFYKTRQPPFKEQLGNSSEVNQTIVEDAG